MPASRSSRVKTSHPEVSEVSDHYSSPPSKSRKRSASLQESLASLSDEAAHSAESNGLQPKRLKKAEPGSPQFRSLSPVTITNQSAILRNLSRKLSFEVPEDSGDDFLVVEEPSTIPTIPAPSPSKRVRRPTEKSLYLSQDKGETSRKEQKRVEFDSKDSMAVDSHPSHSRSAKTQEKSRKEPNRVKVDSKAVDSHSSHSRSVKTQSSKGKNAARLPPQSSAAEKSHERVVVKTESIHATESIRSPSPIVISSEESNPATPKGKEPIRDNRRVSRLPHESTRSPDKVRGRNHAQLADAVTVVDQDMKSSEDVLPPPTSSAEIDQDTKSLEDVPTKEVKEVYLEDLMPTEQKTRFSLVPFDIGSGPASCPAHLLHTNDDGTTSPLELVAAAFELLEGVGLQSISSAMRFKELQPFVDVSAVLRKQIYAEKFRHHVMWQGRNRSVIFTMLGSVQSCNIVEPTSIGQYVCRAITIIPYGDAWQSFQIFLGRLYGEGQMRGPFEYGCLLTLSSRREGYSSTADVTSMLTPATPKKNKKAFGGAGVAATAEWYDSKLPNCIDFDKPIPIYDASRKPFLFTREDFAAMPSLPLYMSGGKIADLPVDSLVSVFFAMSSYPKRSAGSSGASGPASFTDTLSLNIHSVVYYGVIPP